MVDQPTRLSLGGLTFGAVPYQRSAAGFSVAAEVAVGAGVDVLLAHQAFHGQQVGTNWTFRTDGRPHLPKGVRWVMAGHLHPRQVVYVGEASVVCPGSTIRTSVAERGETKGFAVWSWGSSVTWEFRDLPSRPIRVVGDGQVQAQLDAIQPGDLVRVNEPTAPRELAKRVLARGGWLLGQRNVIRSSQQSLL